MNFAVQSASLLSDIFNCAPQGMVYVVPVYEAEQLTDFVVDNLNEAGKRWLKEAGWDGRQVQLTACFPPVSDTKLIETLAGALKTGESVSQELQVEKAQKRSRLTIRPVGEGLIIFIEDIPEVRRVISHTGANFLVNSHLQAQQQAELLENVMTHTPIGLSLLDPIREPTADGSPGRIVDFIYRMSNVQNSRLTGRLPAELVGRRVSDLFVDWQRTPEFKALVDVCETGQPINYTRQYNAYGINAWFDIYYVKQGEGVLLTFLDVSVLKQTEQDLQKQAELLRGVMNNTPTGVVLYEVVRNEVGEIEDFIYRLTNEANARATGRSVEEMTGQRLLAIFPASREVGFYDLLVRVAQSGETYQWTFNFVGDGIDGWFEGVLVPQNDTVLYTFIEVTPLKVAEKTLQQHVDALERVNADLRRSNEYLQQFAYVASHDLQEPLRKIQQFGDMLTMRYGETLPAEGRDMVTRMQTAASRMSRLVSDLLAYSRLTTQKQPFQPVSLDAVISNVLQDQELTILSLGAHIRVDPMPTIVGDSTQLHQLFNNLISNALKYVQSGETPVVNLTSRRVKADEVPVHILPVTIIGKPMNDTYWEIVVADEGIGFDEKYLDRLFGMFQRLHGKTKYQGSGMGLAICKRVVDNHLGFITARSQPGKGATFLVYLPD